MSERVTQQQKNRYKSLSNTHIKHRNSVYARSCSSGNRCLAQGRSPRYYPPTVGGTYTSASVPAPCAVSTRRIRMSFLLQRQENKLSVGLDTTRICYVKPFTCTFDDCTRSEPFNRKNAWVTHEREQHRRLKAWACNIGVCSLENFVTYRQQRFKYHLNNEHRYDERSSRAIETFENSTTRHSGEEPCVFCRKICESWMERANHHEEHFVDIIMLIPNLIKQQHIPTETVVQSSNSAPGKSRTETCFNVATTSATAPLEFPLDSLEPRSGICHNGISPGKSVISESDMAMQSSLHDDVISIQGDTDVRLLGISRGVEYNAFALPNPVLGGNIPEPKRRMKRKRSSG